jgi:cysteine desulfurase
MTTLPIAYLDHNATTPCAPEVVEAMLPFFRGEFANPSSTHLMGRRASEAVETAREQVARLIGCRSNELFFTAGATESNNLVLQGLRSYRGERGRIVISSIEHKSVLEPCRRLAEQGVDVVELPVTSSGVIDLDSAERAINSDTFLVSIQGANNEIGSIQPIKTIANISHRHGSLFHCDAAQMLGKVPVHIEQLDVDLASFSSHKSYGPKGVGALYIKAGAARTAIEPLLLGGGQESDVRPGTLNVPAIVGFGVACKLAFDLVTQEMDRIRQQRDAFERLLFGRLSNAFVIATEAERLPGTSSIYIGGVPADALIARMPLVCIGTGSACTSGALSPSHVLLACGLSREDARCVIRVSIGRFTTEHDLQFAIDRIVENANAIRSYSGFSQEQFGSAQMVSKA